jgi:hypothetical protein
MEQEQPERVPLNMDTLNENQLGLMAQTLIREGYLQEGDRHNTARIKARWVLREKTTQVSARDLKERPA